MTCEFCGSKFQDFIIIEDTAYCVDCLRKDEGQALLYATIESLTDLCDPLTLQSVAEMISDKENA